MTEYHFHDTWLYWLRRAMAGLAIGFVLLSTVYILFQISVVRENMQELARVKSEMETLSLKHDANIRDTNARLDEIERVLFGDVVAKIEKAPLTTRVELWQKNRDKELRDRIQRLERWRAQWEN